MTTYYSEEHEWITIEGDIAIVGITAHAAEQLGDIVFIEQKEEGDEFESGDEIGVIESVKAASEIYAPVDGEVNISVYNMLGELVEEVTNDIYSAGEHTVTFKSNKLGQGTYFVKMTTAGWSSTRSMNLVK